MSTEANKAVVRRFLEEVIGKGNLAAIPEVIAPNWVNHDPVLPPLAGREGARQLVMLFRSGLPDLHVTTEYLLAEGDKVALHMVATGTHTGVLLEVPPTGKTVTFRATGILRVADGLIVENTVTVDALSLMQQIGAVPTPERA